MDMTLTGQKWFTIGQQYLNRDNLKELIYRLLPKSRTNHSQGNEIWKIVAASAPFTAVWLLGCCSDHVIFIFNVPWQFSVHSHNLLLHSHLPQQPLICLMQREGRREGGREESFLAHAIPRQVPLICAMFPWTCPDLPAHHIPSPTHTASLDHATFPFQPAPLALCSTADCMTPPCTLLNLYHSPACCI